MRILPYLTICLFLFASCNTQTPKQTSNKTEKQVVEFNQQLADELAKRADLDQTAAWIPQGKFKEYSREQWQIYKDSVFTTNKKYLEVVLDEFGYPGIDRAGEDGSYNFWLMSQHCDFDVAFQDRVLKEMKKELDKDNVKKSNYALLVDRVRKNKGEKLLYGTQVQYNRATGQAYPRPLEDSVNVNKRRAEVGLESLEVYLNQMTTSHFEMNKDNMLKRGIKEPLLYEVQ